MSITSLVREDLVALYAQLPSRVHPDAATVQTDLLDWFRAVQWASWSTRAEVVAQHRMCELASRAYPDAVQPLAYAQAMAWLTIIDDHVEGVDGHADPDVRALLTLLDGSESPSHWSGGVLGQVLAALWPSLTQGMSLLWESRLRAHFASCFHVESLWRTARASGTAPTLEEYILGRRQDGPFTVGLDLIETQIGQSLPAEVFYGDAVQQLWNAAADVAAWTNDLLSADRELASDDVINLVRVLEHEGRTRQAAVQHAMTMLQQRMDDLVSASAALQHATRNEPHEISELAVRWATALCTTVRGLYEWSVSTRRYKPMSTAALTA